MNVIAAAAITVFLFKSGLFVFAVPAPVVYIFANYGRKAGWLAFLLSAIFAIAMFWFGVMARYDAAYLGWLMMISLVIGEGVERKWNGLRLGSVAVVVPWIAGATCFFVAQFGLGVPLIEIARANFSGILKQFLEMKQVAIPAPQLSYIQNNLPEITNFAVGMMPAMAFLFGIFVTAISILVVRTVSKKRGSLSYLKEFGQFPFWFVWTVIGFGCAYFADYYVVHNIYLKLLAINGLIACAGIYFLQGFMVISCWLRKGKSPLLRLAVYGLLIAFLQVVSIAIIALGLSDQWVDFRKRLRGSQSPQVIK